MTRSMPEGWTKYRIRISFSTFRSYLLGLKPTTISSVRWRCKSVNSRFLFSVNGSLLGQERLVKLQAVVLATGDELDDKTRDRFPLQVVVVNERSIFFRLFVVVVPLAFVVIVTVFVETGTLATLLLLQHAGW